MSDIMFFSNLGSSKPPKPTRAEIISELDAVLNRAIGSRMIPDLDLALIFDAYAQKLRIRFACTAPMF
jgi:hypothetical protein